MQVTLQVPGLYGQQATVAVNNREVLNPDYSTVLQRVVDQRQKLKLEQSEVYTPQINPERIALPRSFEAPVYQWINGVKETVWNSATKVVKWGGGTVGVLAVAGLLGDSTAALPTIAVLTVTGGYYSVNWLKNKFFQPGEKGFVQEQVHTYKLMVAECDVVVRAGAERKLDKLANNHLAAMEELRNTITDEKLLKKALRDELQVFTYHGQALVTSAREARH